MNLQALEPPIRPTSMATGSLQDHQPGDVRLGTFQHLSSSPRPFPVFHDSLMPKLLAGELRNIGCISRRSEKLDHGFLADGHDGSCRDGSFLINVVQALSRAWVRWQSTPIFAISDDPDLSRAVNGQRERKSSRGSCTTSQGVPSARGAERSSTTVLTMTQEGFPRASGQVAPNVSGQRGCPE